MNECRQKYAMSDVVFEVVFEDAVTPLDNFKSAGRLMAGSAAFVVVFDITQRSSFDHVSAWISMAQSYCKVWPYCVGCIALHWMGPVRYMDHT